MIWIGDTCYVEGGEKIKISCNINGHFIFPCGGQIWYKNGEFHREGGPAFIVKSGRKEWWLNGKFQKSKSSLDK